MTNQSLKTQIVKKVSELTTAGFGLVAALAWNDAIQSLFAEIFGKQNAVWAKFVYAIIITGLVVLITTKLAKLLKNDLNNE